MKKNITIALLGLGMITGLAVAAPKPDVSAKKHPNLEHAQADITKAWDDVTAAQKANEFDMDGHAQKAKDALDIANKEIKLAAEAANKNAK